MKSCGVLLLTALVVCFADEEPARNATKESPQKKNLSREEVREYCCSFPPDPAVEERIGKRIMCAPPPVELFPNGTLIIPKKCSRRAASSKNSAPKPPSRCDTLRRMDACMKDREAQNGNSPEQIDLNSRICYCEADRYAMLVRKCEAPEVQEEPFCVEQRRRRESEAKCRKDSGLTSRQLRDGRCKLPEDGGVQEKLAKYSMCSLLNSGEMFANGTTKMIYASVKCSDATSTTTEAPPNNRNKQEYIAVRCEEKKKYAACVEATIAEQANGVEQEKKALAHRVCKCKAEDAIAKRYE
ncbi:hypothetical protein R5R35_009009 [Gryllus longicercus]|uniref:Uncharacterized protein n=1 Tax=Gryllus longicercus TaxID=2509291 RepID=A0AAN9VR07_9ORTH